MSTPILEQVDGSAVIGRHGNLLLGAWWSTATVTQVEAIRAHTDQILEDHPGFITAVLILDGHGVFRFPEDVRQAMVKIVADTEEVGWGTAFVVLRGGFVAAAVRAFMTGVFLVARSKEPQRAFGDVPAAAGWLAERTRICVPDRPSSPVELERTLDHLVRFAGEIRGD